MLWCAILLLCFNFISVSGAGASCTDVEEHLTTDLLVHTNPVTWSLTLTLDYADTINSLSFLHASDSSMNLVGDIPNPTGTTWWPCFFFLPNAEGCWLVSTDSCTKNVVMNQVTWSQIQEGRMFWFLLEADTETNTYSLTSHIEINYNDTSLGEVVTKQETTKEEGLTVSDLENALGLNLPDLEARVTKFTTSIPISGKSSVELKFEVYNSDESTWSMYLEEDPWVVTDDAAIDSDSITVTEGSGGDREWIVKFDVEVCSVGTETQIQIYKGLQAQSVQFQAFQDVNLNLQSLCSGSHNLGTLSASTEIGVYSDSGHSTEATSFFLDETLYIQSTFHTFSDLSAITIESAKFIQDSESDITSLVTTTASTTTTHSSSLVLSDSFVDAAVSGSSGTLSITYSLTYASSSSSLTRRRLTENYDLHSLKKVINVKESGCRYVDGLIAHPGETEKISCSFSGYKMNSCVDNQWILIDDSTCFSLYEETNEAIICFSLLLVCYFAFNNKMNFFSKLE